MRMGGGTVEAAFPHTAECVTTTMTPSEDDNHDDNSDTDDNDDADDAVKTEHFDKTTDDKPESGVHVCIVRPQFARSASTRWQSHHRKSSQSSSFSNRLLLLLPLRRWCAGAAAISAVFHLVRVVSIRTIHGAVHSDARVMRTIFFNAKPNVR